MTASTSAADQTFTVILDDDEELLAEGRLHRIEAGPTWAKHRVKIELDEGDTSGHAAGATDVSISLLFEDDVEGHALSLHFPNAAKADEFRRRLMVSGIVAGALVVGVSAAQLTATAPTTSVALPAPIVAPAPAPVDQPIYQGKIPASELAPIVAPAPAPVDQPIYQGKIPASELAPIVAPAVPPSAVDQPIYQGKIPASELAPSGSATDPSTTPAVPGQHLRHVK